MGDPLLQLPSAQNTAASHIGLGVNPSTQNLPSSGVSPPNVIPNAATIGIAQATQQTFDPMLFFQQLSTQILTVAPQPQTIVVKSRANKSHESEAKFNNNLLQLLLVASDADLLTPGMFTNSCIPKYIRAMKNNLAQSTSVWSTPVG